MVDRLISLLVALCLAFLVWLYARSRDQESLDNVPIPVQITLAPGQADHYDLEVNGPAQIQASFTGPPSRIRELRQLLRRGEVNVEVTFAVPEDRQNEVRFLDTVRVGAADIPAPPGLIVTVLEGRNRIPVTLHRVVERSLEVRADLGRQERVSQVICAPSSVIVRGPQEILDRLRTFPTQPCALPPVSEQDPTREASVTVTVPFVEQLEGRPVHAKPATARVQVTFQPRQKTYVLQDLPILFLCPPNFDLQPQFRNERDGKITVRVTGPAGAEPPPIVAYIDLTRGKFKPGLYAKEPVCLQLPRDFQLVQDPPPSADFQLTAIPPGPNIRTELGVAVPAE